MNSFPFQVCSWCCQSPAVVVPQLLTLQQRGFGVEQGIPTLVMAASSFDDVIAISLFGVFLGIAFSEG